MAETTPQEQPVAPEADLADGIDLGDRVFADVIPGPPAPNTQPATQASKEAVANEAVARRKAIRKGLRDRAASDRLFSGENANRSPKEKASLLGERHDQYAQLMALNCIKPLAQGIDASSLTEAVSTAAVMWALSPRFRKVMAEYNTKINETLRITRAKNFEAKSQVPLGSNRDAVDSAQAAAQREDKAMLDQVSAVLQGSETVPFSTESAAMSLLQVHEDAYVALRQGEDEEVVTAGLRETVDELTQIWKSQRLDPKLVVATARTLAGQTEDDEDLRLAQFVETAGGSVRPSEQSLATGSGGVAVASWGGQWSLATGGILNSANSPMFTVRKVGDARSHQDSLSTLVFQDLELAAKSGPAELRKAVVGHWAAWELREFKLDDSEVGGASRDRAVACAQRSRVAYVAMADDGIEDDIRQKVASNALLNGMTAFETANPEAVALMVKEFGESHSEAAAQLVAMGKERGRHVPLQPLVFKPSNPAHTAQMADYKGPKMEPERARDLGVEAPRPSVVAPWGPRAHPDVLAAEQSQRQVAGETPAPPRSARTEPVQPVRRSVDKQEPAADAPARTSAAAWQLVSPKENAERRARGYQAVDRVPLGMKTIPTDQAEYEREVAKRAELEAVEARGDGPAPSRQATRKHVPTSSSVPQSSPRASPGPNPTAATGQRPAWIPAEPHTAAPTPRSPWAPEARVSNGDPQQRARPNARVHNQHPPEGNAPRDRGRHAGPDLNA